MDKDQWVEEVGRGFSRSMPDQFPEEYAYWLAREKANRGAYEAYLSGEFESGILYRPDERWP